MPTRYSALGLLILPVLLATNMHTAAQEPSRNVTIYVGYTPGGGYDLYARLFARHFGKHLPGHPPVVVSNMPGAGSIRAANYIYNVAPKDGTALGVVAQTVAEEQLLGTSGVSYDVVKLNWIGRFAQNIEASYVWHTAPVKTLDDLRTTEATFAGTGASSVIYPRLLNSIAGMKWKVIMGYTSTNGAHLAMQRGEVNGASSSLNTLKTMKEEWLQKGLINVLVQYAFKRAPDFASVPAVIELARTQEDKDVLTFFANSGAVGRGVFAPPGLSAERLHTLRTAFDATMKDPEYRAEVATARLDFDPITGAELQSLIESATRVSPEVLKRARAVRTE